MVRKQEGPGTFAPRLLVSINEQQPKGLFARRCCLSSRRCCGPPPPTAWRRANRHLVDVAILAALNPKHLAGRGPRIGWQAGIDPREVVEDDNRAEVFVNDVAAVAYFELLRERPHGARLALR